MRPNDAIEQVEYIRRVLDETHVQVATFAPYLTRWGVVWTIGYLGHIRVSWIWSVVVPVGILGTALLGMHQGRHAAPATPLLELRPLVLVGGWLVVAGLATLPMPLVPSLVRMAVAGGGGMIVSGLIVARLPSPPAERRHLRAVESA